MQNVPQKHVYIVGNINNHYAKKHQRKKDWFKANKIRTPKPSNSKRKRTNFNIKISTQKIIQ